MEKIKKIFSNYPISIAYFFPLVWSYPGFYLFEKIIGICSSPSLSGGTVAPLVIGSFSFMILTNWIGLFFSKKLVHYIVGGILWGSLWSVGFVAVELYNCN